MPGSHKTAEPDMSPVLVASLLRADSIEEPVTKYNLLTLWLSFHAGRHDSSRCAVRASDLTKERKLGQPQVREWPLTCEMAPPKRGRTGAEGVPAVPKPGHSHVSNIRRRGRAPT